MCVTALVAGTLASTAIGASSAKSAAKAQAQAAKDANDTQLQIFREQTELTEPWREAGKNALSAMQFELGMAPRPVFGGGAMGENGEPLTIQEIPGGSPSLWGNSDSNSARFLRMLDRSGPRAGVNTGPTMYSVGGQNFDTRDSAQAYIDSQAAENPGIEYQGFKADPGYQFRLEQGIKGIENMAAMRGLRMSGATLKDAGSFNSGLASQEYGNYWNRLAGLAGVGQTANSQQINAGTNYANAFGNNARAAGAATASGYMGVNNALQGGMNNMFQIYGMNQSGMFGGSAVGGGGFGGGGA